MVMVMAWANRFPTYILIAWPASIAISWAGQGSEKNYLVYFDWAAQVCIASADAVFVQTYFKSPISELCMVCLSVALFGPVVAQILVKRFQKKPKKNQAPPKLPAILQPEVLNYLIGHAFVSLTHVLMGYTIYHLPDLYEPAE
mmetsp:Transcript_32741/g.51094  ORF Transcript_32741/g.51094 Transcript_32741/m.51094 type:complete len:143 (+) Transcript_32741:449-877(+)